METQKIQHKNGKINIILRDRQSGTQEQQSVTTNDHFTVIDEAFAPFIGLHRMKQAMREVYATIMVNEKRRALGMTGSKQVLHMLFKGNPGTGKTTVARCLAKLYHQCNLLSKGHFIEAERADLVGEYIGQTAQKTRALIQKALGGILFIDEAYSLARGGNKDFGKEAVDTLVKHMEDHQHDFVLILAGYPLEMDRFLALNPGLKSRFPFILEFENYSTTQLMEMARQMAAKKEYQLTTDAEWKLKYLLNEKLAEDDWNFSNGRYIRNIMEQAIRQHAFRLMQSGSFTADDLFYLRAPDIQPYDVT